MRRASLSTVLIGSVIAAVVCLVLAVLLALHHTAWALVPALLTVWFAVDAWRALGWSRAPAKEERKAL